MTLANIEEMTFTNYEAREKSLEEIRTNYDKICKRAFNEGELDFELEMKKLKAHAAQNFGHEKQFEEEREQHAEEQRRLQNIAVALGWVLGIPEDETIYACDPSF